MSSNKNIFKEDVLPIMKEEQKKLEDAQREEYIKHISSSQRNMLGGIGPDGGMSAMGAFDNSILTTGEWNKKTADDYLNAVKAQLSKKGITVTLVVEQQMIDYLIDQKMPKSTTEYLIQKIKDGNIFGSVLPSSRTALEGHIKREAEQKYNPSLMEEFVGEVSAFVSNAAVTLGQGTIASFIGQTGLSMIANSTDQSEKQQKEYIEQKKKEANKEIATANSKQVNIPQWMAQQTGIVNPSGASTEKLLSVHQWAVNSSLNYRKKVQEAANHGSLAVKASGKSNYISLSDATLLAKQYETFAKNIENELTNRMQPPKWMLDQMGFNNLSTATDQQLRIAQQWADGNAKSYRNKIHEATCAGFTSVKASGKASKIPIDEATARAMQYETFAKAVANEISNRKVQENVSEHIEESVEEDVNTQQTTPTSYGQNSPTPATTGDYSGWNGLLSNMGLTGTSDTMKNLGLSLATLPDMLIRLFTGKTKNEGLSSDTILPFALLIGGTFIKNPLLKIPLLLLGAMNLLNKSNQQVNEKYNPQLKENQVQYKQYADELLDKRLKNPQIEGNVLLVDIDNIPRIVTLPPTVIDAYKAGSLPLNTIANRILSKLEQNSISESQSVQVSEKYDNNQTREQTKGIR